MRKRKIRIFILAAVFISLGTVAYKVAKNLWFQKLLEIKQNPVKILDFVPETALQLKRFRRSKIEGGRKVWEVTGEDAVFLKAEKEAVIKKPRLVFYYENGDTMEVNGEEGHLLFTDRDMERVELRGAVEVHYQGFVLQTHEILYLQSDDQVISRGKVRLRGEGLSLEGVGMEVSLRDEKIQLHDSVWTKIQPDKLGNKRFRSKS